MLGCFGLTEPMSGSDAQTMVTGAEKTSGGCVLNGAKNWITNGPHADHIIVFAVTDRSTPKVKHTAFLVKKGTPGLHAEPARSQARHPRRALVHGVLRELQSR